MPSENAFLARMLDRLFAAVVGGPGLNCRPHASRQRVDLTQFSRLGDISPEEVLRKLLSPHRSAKLSAKTPPPKRVIQSGDDDKTPLTEAEKAALSAWTDQQSLTAKLRTIVEDAKTYEQDTGVHVLQLGFPLLSLPPIGEASKGRFDSGTGGGSRRILAPIAFIPVAVSIKRGSIIGVEIACKGEGVDRVVPNTALLAWLEQHTGK